MVKLHDINIIREPKLLESDDEDQKNYVSSDEEGIMYMRRDSQQSNSSSKSTSSVDSASSETSVASTVSVASLASVESTVSEVSVASVASTVSEVSVASVASVESTVSEVAPASEVSLASNPEKEQSVDELSDQLNSLQVDTEEKSACKVESLTEKLKTSLKVQDDENVVERSPMKNDYLGPSRHSNDPYPQPQPQQNYRQINHYGGGLVQQNDYNICEPVLNQYNNIPVPVGPLLELNTVFDLTDYLNNLAPSTVDSSVLNEPTSNFLSPPATEPTYPPAQASSSSFLTRRASPAPSSSAESSSAYSSDVLSPQSCTSVDTDSSQAIGSPLSLYDLPSTSGISLSCSHSSLSCNHSPSPTRLEDLYDLPSTSGVSLRYNHSPARLEDLPKTLPNSSDEEPKRKEALNAMRKLIDHQYMEIKKYEWIKACQKEDVEELFSDLRKLLTELRFNIRRLVRIYATIAIILKRKGHLRQFFMEESQILCHVAKKNHPLLLRYIIETMQNLGLNPELIENPAVVIRKVIDHNQDMTDMLNTLLSIRNVHNLPMFDVNQPDDEGFTPIHYILSKINQMENCEGRQLYMNYLKIILESQPDLSFRTRLDNRTYLHHAVAWGCGPDTVKMILQYAQRGDRLLNFNLVQEVDNNGDSALRLAANLTQGRHEIEDILLEYDAINVYPQIDPFNRFDDLDPFV